MASVPQVRDGAGPPPAGPPGPRGPSRAAARLAALPLLAALRARTAALYAGAKRGRPGLRAACEGLEGGVAAALGPLLGRLEPHASIADAVACKGLDWLEAAFPVLRAPPEQVVATAKTKMAELQEAAVGSAGRVSTGVAWLLVRLEGAQGPARRPPAGGSTGEGRGLRANDLSDARPLDDAEKPEAAALRGVLERLLALATKLYRRLFLTSLVLRDTRERGLTLVWVALTLPRYLQRQLGSAVFLLSRTRDRPTTSATPRRRPRRSPACPPEICYLGAGPVLQATPLACRPRKPGKSPAGGDVDGGEGCADHRRLESS